MRALAPVLVWAVWLALGVEGVAAAEPEVGASDGPSALEQAQRCLRRGDLACAKAQAEVAAKTEVAAERREALWLLLEVHGLTPGEEAETQAACRALLSVWPTFEPPPDAAPSIVAGCRQARAEAANGAASGSVGANGPGGGAGSDAEGPSGAGDSGAAAGKALAGLDVSDTARAPRGPRERRWSVSLGLGPAIPLGASADRFEVGIQALVDLRHELDTCWALWFQAGLALLRLDSSLPIEPHQGSGLTVFTVALGVERRFPLAAQLEGVVAVALGVGGFGLDGVDDGLGLGLSPSAGVRWQADQNLSVRLDFAPTLIVPFSDTATGGHLSAVLRGEARF